MPRDLELLLEDLPDAARGAVRYASNPTQDGFELMPTTDWDRYRALKEAVTELREVVKKYLLGKILVADPFLFVSLCLHDVVRRLAS